MSRLLLTASLLAALLWTGVARADEPRSTITIDVAIDPSDHPSGAVPMDAALEPGHVALTFDDGPNPKTTPRVLDILDSYRIRATFFVVGWRAERYPELVQEIILRGHTVASHTYKHRYLNLIPFADARREIIKGHRMILRAAGPLSRHVVPFFRFPGGKLNSNARLLELVSELGLVAFHWNISSHDTSAPERAEILMYERGERFSLHRRRELTEDVILGYVVRDIGIHGSGMVLLHDTKRATVRVLPAILEELVRPRRLRGTADALGIARFTTVRLVKAQRPRASTEPAPISLSQRLPEHAGAQRPDARAIGALHPPRREARDAKPDAHVDTPTTRRSAARLPAATRGQQRAPAHLH